MVLGVNFIFFFRVEWLVDLAVGWYGVGFGVFGIGLRIYMLVRVEVG